MNNGMTPQSHRDIIFPNAATAQLVDDLITNRLEFPVDGKNGLLLYGPNGTGKTTLAKLLPNELEQARTQQNASTPVFYRITVGNNGAALMARIADAASLAPLGDTHHYFILDEVDNLGAASMQSLKAAMAPTDAIFIMTTNKLSAIERGVVSRSHLIDMTAPPPEAWLARCREVLMAHGVTKLPRDEALLPLIASCNGDAREILTEMRKLALVLAGPSPNRAGQSSPMASAVLSSVGTASAV